MKHSVQRRPVHQYRLTREGRQRYSARLQELRDSRRDILEQIRHASDQQASEPLDTADGVSRLQSIDQELAELDFILAHSTDYPSKPSHTVTLGAKVTLRSRIRQYVVVLVESIEADPDKGYISLSSPLGKLLMGKRSHDQLALQTHRGVQQYEILAVE